jgi:hypothetical protein
VAPTVSTHHDPYLHLSLPPNRLTQAQRRRRLRTCTRLHTAQVEIARCRGLARLVRVIQHGSQQWALAPPLQIDIPIHTQPL